MFKRPMLAIFIIILVVGCATPTVDPAFVQTAIAQTAASNPISTNTPLPSDTPTPSPSTTSTMTPTLTSPPPPTPTSTPDIRVIDGDPRDYLLQTEDLPREAKYYLPDSSWISPHRNSEIVSGWGVEEGRVYLEKTGRVDGWWVAYLRGTQTIRAPEEIYNNVVIYRTIEGAKLIISEFSGCADPERGYVVIETDLNVGDQTAVCIIKEMQSNGKNRVWYRIEFIYRNFYHALVGYGWESEVQPELMEMIARTLLAKLEAAPLSEKVTFIP